LIYPVVCGCPFRFDALSIATSDVYISVYSLGWWITVWNVSVYHPFKNDTRI